jgi:protoporphyrin/coproporphyrin ferrochelatase
MKNKKIAVVLMNLGGPDSLDAVRPFLFNLFNDPAIIRIPQPFRYCLAWLISTLRCQKAKGIYEKLGGKSPLLSNTILQQNALLDGLQSIYPNISIHICMRYWHPMVDEVMQELLENQPDHIVLLPLYPQYSTTTTGSSVRQMEDAIKSSNLKSKVYVINDYPTDPSFIAAHVNLIQQCLNKPLGGHVRILFSAHGVPQDVIDEGDPYEKQIHQTVSKIMETFSKYDHRICYQSKVGPKKWLGPSIHEMIEEASRDKVSVLVVPIAFVSDHSETLVELDVDYKEMASRLNVPYQRVPVLGTHSLFIESLKNLVIQAVGQGDILILGDISKQHNQ